MSKIKTVKDYVSQVHEKFPLISENDIQRILEFGFRHFYLMNTAGADFLLSGKGNILPTFYCYVGKILKNDGLMRRYVCIKRTIKFRLRWIRRKVLYDGFYYFNVNQEQYDSYLAQKTKKRALITFPGEVVLHKIPSEVIAIGDQVNCYVFKIEMDEEKSFTKKFKDGSFSTKNAIYLGKRKPDGNINYVNDNEKRSSKQPRRRHNNRLYASKHSK